MLEVNSGLGNSASPLLYNQIVLHWRSYNTDDTSNDGVQNM